MERYTLIDDDLIYYRDPEDERQRLYIFKICEKVVFEIIYDERVHADFYRVYDKIRHVFYIR